MSTMTAPLRERLCAEIRTFRDDARHEPEGLAGLLETVPDDIRNGLLTDETGDAVLLYRLARMLLESRGRHAFLLKQDGFASKEILFGMLANLADWTALLLAAQEPDAGPADLKPSIKFWRLALQGLFCFHMAWPREHHRPPPFFSIDAADASGDIIERVHTHYGLLIVELQKLKAHPEHFRNFNAAELDELIIRMIQDQARLPKTETVRKTLKFPAMRLK